uniref:Cilia and flagella associated protein 99 n=1 Tax=Myripristis murdjan TaxID=586833 RepID=A0A668AB97_9TELE
MASMYGSLVKEATVLLDQFSADKLCLDDFMENASKTLQNMDAPDRNFLLDVVSGCIEHKKLLDVVVNAFYAQNGKCLSRGDRSTFVIICYLATFTMDDLGLECFSKIVKSLDTKKMHKFLSFFFDVTNLTTWIQGEWSHIYDAAFVEKNWIAPLLRWRPEIDILMDQLAARMSSGSRAKKAPVKTTEPQEFCLTKPKPRPLPMPEPIPQQEKPKPVPKSTHRAPKEMHTIEEIKQKNRQKAQESFDSQLKFNSFQSSGVPASLKMNSSWPIKLNNTAIMRQEALYNRQVEEELRRMERLVEGAQEPSSFLQWQKQMRDQDLQEELAQLELRRLQGLISHKEAAMARTHIMERNQKAAQLQKEETAQLMQRYARKRLQEEKEMRDLVQQVADGHKNTKAAKQRLQELKQSIVKEVSEQSQELLRQALEEAQAELSRKFEIIREIHAIRSVPHMRHKFVDDTETGGHDLLGEMSLAELKERLAILKEAKQREQEERREWILEEKQSKQQLLLQQLDTIDIHRKALAQAAASRKEEKKARRGLQQAVAKDERVLALQKRLEEKQQEHLRLKQRESSKAKTSEQAAAHTKTLEDKDWEDLEQRLARQIQ